MDTALEVRGISKAFGNNRAIDDLNLVIPRGGPVKDLRAYVRHERAHCNGWPEDHPE